MRFPFFATNRTVNWVRDIGEITRSGIRTSIVEMDKELSDLKQKVLALEGRVNTLEVWKNHGRKKGK